MKRIILISLIICAAQLQAQDDFTNAIEKASELTVSSVERLSRNYAPHIKEYYAVYFSDGSTQLYDADADYLDEEKFTVFKLRFQSFVAKSDGKWKVYQDNDGYLTEEYGWIQTGEFEAECYDSIGIIDFEHYAGYKDGDIILFHFDHDSLAWKGFVNIGKAELVFGSAFYDGIFIKQENPESCEKKIRYVHEETGELLSRLQCDTMLHRPTVFMENTLVKNDGEEFVYSFKNDTILERDFRSSMFVPLYDYPIVFKDNYIAFGAENWNRAEIDRPIEMEFVMEGDLVGARIVTEKMDTLYLDLWMEELVTGI